MGLPDREKKMPSRMNGRHTEWERGKSHMVGHRLIYIWKELRYIYIWVNLSYKS